MTWQTQLPDNTSQWKAQPADRQVWIKFDPSEVQTYWDLSELGLTTWDGDTTRWDYKTVINSNWQVQS